MCFILCYKGNGFEFFVALLSDTLTFYNNDIITSSFPPFIWPYFDIEWKATAQWNGDAERNLESVRRTKSNGRCINYCKNAIIFIPKRWLCTWKISVNYGLMTLPFSLRWKRKKSYSTIICSVYRNSLENNQKSWVLSARLLYYRPS